MTSGKEFKAQLGTWATRAGDKLDALLRQSAYEVAERVVRDTPVDTGFLRGNWQPSIGIEPTVQEKAADPSGAATMADIGLTFEGVQAGDRVWLINNTAYGPFVESGTSKTPGRFFVADNVKAWPAVVEKIAQELKIRK